MKVSEKKYVEFRCPKCGSDDIVEWNNVPTRYEVERVSIDEDGRLEVDYTGHSETMWELCEVTGYSCRDYCFEGPLEDFVVKD